MGADTTVTNTDAKRTLIDMQRHMTWYYNRFEDLSFVKAMIQHFIDSEPNVNDEVINAITAIIDFKIKNMEEHYKDISEGLSGLRICIKDSKDKPKVDSTYRMSTPERTRDF